LNINLDLFKSNEIEQPILAGGMTRDGVMILENLQVRPEDFYSNRHQLLYKAITDTYKEKNNIDLLLLVEYCKKKNIIDKVGGTTYITEISGCLISITQLNAYANILKNYRLKRDVLEISKIIEIKQELEPKELLNLVQEQILSIQKKAEIEKTQEDCLKSYLEAKEKSYIGENEEDNAIKTGLWKLDTAIHGFSKAELITIFAFSGVGKTTVAGQLALNIARYSKKRVMYFSLEMTYTQVMDRLVSNVTDIEHRKVKYLNKGELTDEQLVKILTTASQINQYISIYDTRYLDDIISKIQVERIKDNVDIVFIDYISLIQGVQANEERLRIAQITQKLKALANTLNLPIVILAQATQAAEKKNSDNYKPYEKLSDTDIADSASVFRDSDTVLGIYRNTILDDPGAQRDIKVDYNSKDATINPKCVNILVKKCRNSTKKTLAFKWNGAKFRIDNYEQ
jgi:replicative DNA helicase